MENERVEVVFPNGFKSWANKAVADIMIRRGEVKLVVAEPEPESSLAALRSAREPEPGDGPEEE